jgi:integrase
MARLYRKRGIWYAWGITPSGERWARSTRTKDKREAQRRGRRLERDAVAAADVSARASATLSAAFTALYESQETRGSAASTMRTAQQRGGHVLRLLGLDRDIATLMPPDGGEVLRGYVAARVAEGAMRSTVFSEVSMLKQALRTAARAGKWPGDTRSLEVIELRRANKPRRSHLTTAQAARLLVEIPPQWREHAEVYLGTGVRRMELYAITADDLDLAGNRVHVRGTKTDLADRWIPMTPRVRSILVSRIGRDALPFREWTRALPDLAAACERAKLPVTTVTDLRRTFASALLSAGVSSSVLKEILGHSTTKQIDLTYGHASEAAKQDALGLLGPGSRAVADTSGPVRQTRRKRTKEPAETPGNAIRRSTSGNHPLAGLADFSWILDKG